MARRFQQLEIVGLEDLFVKSEGELQVLRDLEYELRHRQVSRARSLLVKVRAAIKAVPITEIGVTTPPHRSEPQVQGESDLFEFEPIRLFEQKPSGSPVKLESEEQTIREIPWMVLPEAYKMLKATPGDSWESIELTRRELVQRASPVLAADGKREQLQSDAERINVAYRLIALDRTKLR